MTFLNEHAIDKLPFSSSRIDDAFDLKSRLTLGTGSNGIDPLAEAVTLTLTGGTGTFTTTIPAGSFIKDKKGRFTFEGTINGVDLEAKIPPRGSKHYEFKAEAKHANLTGIVRPVTVTLTVGDDSGTTTVSAPVRGEERRADHRR